MQENSGMQVANLFRGIPAQLTEELIQTLFAAKGVRLERIVSQGHLSPPGFWYDQDSTEWVFLLQGAARLKFEDREDVELRPGDLIEIPKSLRHRVEWTDPQQQTIWLAIHAP